MVHTYTQTYIQPYILTHTHIFTRTLEEEKTKYPPEQRRDGTKGQISVTSMIESISVLWDLFSNPYLFSPIAYFHPCTDSVSKVLDMVERSL